MANAKVRSPSKPPKVIDLFAGAGLFSYAFLSEGFDVIDAVEIDRVAAATYERNIGNHIRVGDIRRTEPEGTCDVLIAGPPCQGFSTLGKRDQNDPRNRLSMEVARWAKATHPQVIVVENVVAFLESPAWSRLADALDGMGYEIEAITLNAFDFGVPQLRHRSFTFASHTSLPVIELVKFKGVTTVRQAWEGLPRVPDGKHGHFAPRPSHLALARMKVIPLGGDKRDVLDKAPHLAAPSWWKVRSAVTDVWGRMRWDTPCNTLRTCFQNASKGRYIHPEQNRVISLREAARLHSIPDNWEFVGSPAQVARQIGNSVPPFLGRATAKAILSVVV